MIDTNAITTTAKLEAKNIVLDMEPDQQSNIMIGTAVITAIQETEARAIALDMEVLTGASTLSHKAPTTNRNNPSPSSPPNSPHSQSLQP